MIPQEKIKTIEKYCDKIYSNGRQQHIKDMVFDPNRTGKEVNLQGLGAEIWFKEKHNIPYTLFEDKENFMVLNFIDSTDKDKLMKELLDFLDIKIMSSSPEIKFPHINKHIDRRKNEINV